MGALSSTAKAAAKAARKAAAIARRKAAAKRKAALLDTKSKTKKAAASIDDNANEVVGTRERSGFTGRAEKDIEQGKAGEVTSGRKSEPSFADMETSNKGRRTRNDRVSTLETKEEKGIITAKEKVELTRLNKLSSDQEKSRATKSASTRSSNARKAKGISLADGASNAEQMLDPKAFPNKAKIKVGEVKKQPSGQMIGDTTNGINRVTGEMFGTPTPNQIKLAIRDLEARSSLSAEAKRNLAKLKKMTKTQKQDAAIRTMERNLKDTGPDKSGRKLAMGGMAKKKAYSSGGVGTKAKSRTGHSDYRGGGMFYNRSK